MIQTGNFDMDGVIVDTEPVHRYAYFKQFEELNIAVTEQCTLHLRVFLLKYISKIKELFNRARSRRFNTKKTKHL
jgi:beta-phosphoglucomutase-like phosphatase (HAD superfamily)